MNKKLRIKLLVAVWSTFLIISGLTIYVNYCLPHGRTYQTGEVYKEDLRNVSIPGWAKFFRNDNWLLPWLALAFAGMVLAKNEE